MAVVLCLGMSRVFYVVAGFYEGLYLWCEIGAVKLRLLHGMCLLLFLDSVMLVMCSEAKRFSVSSV